MTTPAAFQQFIDDELLRAPLVIEQTLEGLLEHLRKSMNGMAPGERVIAGNVMQALMNRRVRLVDEFVRSLRSQVHAQTAGPAPTPQEHPADATSALSLVDEADVAIDVEISHTIEAIHSEAEYELRELQTFTSALVGDMDVAGDHNPFRPDTQARALWSAAQMLAGSRGIQMMFMRHAGLPMAQVLRKAYSAASTRLEAAGVEPAAYRTLILPAGARTDRHQETGFAPDLNQMLESMPVAPASTGQTHPEFDKLLLNTEEQIRILPPDTHSTEVSRLRETHRSQLVESAGDPVDQQLIELLSRLFDVIVADKRLPHEIQWVLSRLQASALRVVLRDASALDDYTHPLWQFLNRIAFQATTIPAAAEAERQRMMRHLQGIVDHVIGEPAQGADLYRWALGRMDAYEQNRLARRCADEADEIASLQQLEGRLDGSQMPSTFAGALDFEQLDTVPAELLDSVPTAPSADTEHEQWLAERRSGEWLRVVLQGSWVQAQLLWTGERGQVWLLADSATPNTWAVRRGGLLALRAAGLLNLVKPRSLVRDAARQVLKRLSAPSPG